MKCNQSRRGFEPVSIFTVLISGKRLRNASLWMTMIIPYEVLKEKKENESMKSKIYVFLIPFSHRKIIYIYEIFIKVSIDNEGWKE